MSLSKQAKEGIRRGFENYCNVDNFSAPPYEIDTIVDFFFRRFEEEGEEKIAKVKGMFEAFTLMDWSGEAEVYAEIKRLERLVLSIFNE